MVYLCDLPAVLHCCSASSLPVLHFPVRLLPSILLIQLVRLRSTESNSNCYMFDKYLMLFSQSTFEIDPFNLYLKSILFANMITKTTPVFFWTLTAKSQSKHFDLIVVTWWLKSSYTTSTEMTVHRMTLDERSSNEFFGGVQFHRIG